MTNFPLMYIARSEALNKPVSMIVVTSKGKWKMYDTSNSRSFSDSSEEYNEHGANIYNDPKEGLLRYPVSSRNPLGIEVGVQEGVSQSDIDSALKSIRSITEKDIADAYQRYADND